MAYIGKYVVFKFLDRNSVNELAKNKANDQDILVVVNKKFFDPNLIHLGSNKDHSILLDQLTGIYRTTCIAGIVPKSIKSILGLIEIRIRLFQRGYMPKLVILSLSGGIAISVIIARLLFFRQKIVCRMHNAEYPHRLDYARAHSELGEFSKSRLWRRRALIHLISDFVTINFSSIVLPISRFDAFSYFSRLALNKSKVIPLLYAPPIDLFSQSQSQSQPSQDSGDNLWMLSIGSIAPSAITKKQELDFYKFAIKLRKLPFGNKVTFFQSNPQANNIPEFIKTTKKTKKFIEVYEKSQIIVIMGKYGRGAKTKIIDSIFLGKVVISSLSIWERLDVEYQNYVIPIDINDLEKNQKIYEKYFIKKDDGNSEFYTMSLEHREAIYTQRHLVLKHMALL